MREGTEIRSVMILIATYNRWQQLEKALISLSGLVEPKNVSLKIRIIDNATAPPVRESLERFKTIHPLKYPVELIEEPRKGKSHALNRGLQDVNTDLVAFTDDDREFDPCWLAAAVSHFNTCNCSAIHGANRVKTESTISGWVTPRCKELLGETAQDLSEGQWFDGLDGGNMIVRSPAIEENGLFRTDLGPVGNRVGYSEDSEWSTRMLRSGAKFCFCPGALNYHLIEPERLRVSYLLKRQFDYAWTETLLDGQTEQEKQRWQCSSLPREVRDFLGALLFRKISLFNVDFWLEMARRVGRLWGLTLRLKLGTSKRLAGSTWNGT